MVGRAAIHVDINPHSIFLVENLLSPVNLPAFSEAYEKIRAAFIKNAPKTRDQIKAALKKYPHPKGFKLPANSDVDFVEQLFSPIHLAQLAFLKSLILERQGQKDPRCVASHVFRRVEQAEFDISRIAGPLGGQG